ncbi:patatin-like phospholipase family protein [Flavobacterium sp.]|uniref:patatin-like phospholipase family protein n=1 Tax=Flavobacterium sp. TaxID=239 RepID=UPI0037BEC858
MIKKQVKSKKSKVNHIRGTFSCFILFTFACLLLPAYTIAQDSIQKPKIGLVLSGGGAKGLSHIGVLKVIDSLGIKIDYIGGTSMGAIVGGLYASGYTGKQLDSIFKTLEFDDLVQDNIPRKSKLLFNKRNDDIYALSLPFKKLKLETPNALSKGFYNYNFLSKITYHVRNTRDFKKLPIPFFCMATDIETGEEILLNKGIFPQALIASSSVPSIFYPIEIEGKLLVDGGVTNNYPIERLKELGAEFIIGVDVQEELKDRNELQGITTIFGQISNFYTQSQMKSKRQLTNIYIKPEIKGYSVLSFENGKKIIQNGEYATRNFLSELLKFENKAYQKPKLKLVKDSIFIGNIAFTELKNYTRAYVLGKLRFKPNSKVSFEDFQNGIQNLSNTQNFSSLKYQFNEKDIFISLRENKINTYLKFALHYDELYKSAALINISQKKIISKNDMVSLDLILGDNFRYDFNYLIDNGYNFSFGINSSLNNFNKNVNTAFGIQSYLSNAFDKINLDYSSVNTKVFLQTIFLRKFNIGGGLEFQNLFLKSENLSKANKVIENSNYFSLVGFLNYDTFDDKYFPKKGWYLKSNFNYYFSSSDYNNQFSKFSISKTDLGIAVAPIKNFSVVFKNEIGFKIGHSTLPYFDFALGGTGFKDSANIIPFYGYDFLSISGNSYIKSSATFDYEFYKKNHINLTYNASIVGDFIFNATKTWFNKPSNTGFGLGYGLETLIGPIEMKYTWSPESNFSAFWVNLGFVF